MTTKMRIFLTGALLVLAGLVAAPTGATAAACDWDSQRMEDNVPHAGGPGYTTIAVRVSSCDYGYYRVIEAVNVAYYDPKVNHLNSVILRADSYTDGSWYIKGTWDQVWEGRYYFPNVGSAVCYDPCRVKVTGIAVEYGDPDSFFSVSGPAEADD